MAELAALGLAANIVQFIQFGLVVAKRLQDLDDSALYRDIRIELPLLIDSLRRTKEQADTGQLDKETQNSLLPVVTGCQNQIKQLDIFLKALPSADDNLWIRSKKAAASVRNEKGFRQAVNALKGYVQFLTYHQSLTSPMGSTSDNLLSLTRRLTIEPVFLVPFDRDEKFVDRSGVIDQIDAGLQAKRRVALAGIGGVGKSQIAIEYCYRFKEEHPDAHIFWIHAATIPRLRQGYKSMANKLSLPGWDDVNVDVFDLIKTWLSDSDHGSWLLVLDNADDIDIFYSPPPDARSGEEEPLYRDVAQYLPRGPHGQILFTTRDRRLGERLADRNAPILIEPMTGEDAEQLLKSRIQQPDELDSAKTGELLEVLGHLPLAITQAAAFMSENGVTVDEYLAAIKEEKGVVQDMLKTDLGDHRRYSESGSSILTTWTLSFNQIHKQQPLAAAMLSLMAVMDLHSVPSELLVDPGRTFKETTEALGSLKAFSLISPLKGDKSFEMHRLVQLSVRLWLHKQATLQSIEARALSVLSDKFPLGNYEHWKACERLLPHAHTVLEYGAATDEARLQRACLLHNVARYYDAISKYPRARIFWQEALDIRKELLGDEDPKTLQTASFFGETLFRLADYKLGEEVMRFALKGSERLYGPSNTLTRMDMGMLAEILTGQGRFDESEALYRQALEGKEEQLGTDMTDLKNADNLGAVLRRKKQYDEAESWIRRSMIGREQSVGPQHPQTIRAVNHLGLILRFMKRYDEAEMLNRRALAGFEASFGREHHMTLQSLDNLSVVLRLQGGKDAQAEEQARRAYIGLLRLLGPTHRHTLQAQMSLALALEAQKNYSHAESLASDALVEEEESLGIEHPQIQVTAPIVARLLTRNGKLEEAAAVRAKYIAPHAS